MSVVQPTHKRGVLEELGFRTLFVCGDYRELVGLLTLFLLAVVATGSAFGHLVNLALVGACGVGAFYIRPTLIDFGVRGNRRRRRNQFHREWAQLCDLLGWSEALKTHASGKTDDSIKPAKVPDLVRWGSTEFGVWLIIKPLSSQTRDKWPQMADALAREKGYPHQQWSEPNAGLLRIELIGSELPSMVAFDESQHVSDAWDEAPVAVDPAGRLIKWIISQVPHLLVAGSTNGGKGSLLKLIIRHCLTTGWWVVAANPKGSGEFGWAKYLDVPVLRNIDDIEKVTGWLAEEMRRRQQIVEANDAADWTELPPNLRWPPIMLVFDEASSAMMINKADKKMAESQNSVAGNMAVFSMQARAVGIHLLVVAQRPDTQNLGPAGGLFRSNVDARAAVCNLDADGLKMMFGTLDPDIPRHLDGTKGRALFARLDSNGFDVYPGQVFWLSTEELKNNPPPVAITQLAAHNQPLFYANSSPLHLIDDGEVNAA